MNRRSRVRASARNLRPRRWNTARPRSRSNGPLARGAASPLGRSGRSRQPAARSAAPLPGSPAPPDVVLGNVVREHPDGEPGVELATCLPEQLLPVHDRQTRKAAHGDHEERVPHPREVEAGDELPDDEGERVEVDRADDPHSLGRNVNPPLMAKRCNRDEVRFAQGPGDRPGAGKRVPRPREVVERRPHGRERILPLLAEKPTRPGRPAAGPGGARTQLGATPSGEVGCGQPSGGSPPRPAPA